MHGVPPVGHDERPRLRVPRRGRTTGGLEQQVDLGVGHLVALVEPHRTETGGDKRQKASGLRHSSENRWSGPAIPQLPARPQSDGTESASTPTANPSMPRQFTQNDEARKRALTCATVAQRK